MKNNPSQGRYNCKTNLHNGLVLMKADLQLMYSSNASKTCSSYDLHWPGSVHEVVVRTVACNVETCDLITAKKLSKQEIHAAENV